MKKCARDLFWRDVDSVIVYGKVEKMNIGICFAQMYVKY